MVSACLLATPSPQPKGLGRLTAGQFHPCRRDGSWAGTRDATKPDGTDLSVFSAGLLSELLSGPQPRYRPMQDVGRTNIGDYHM